MFRIIPIFFAYCLMRGHDACRMPLRQWCGVPFPAALQR